MNSLIQSIPRGEADDWKPYAVIGVILATVIALHPLKPGSFGTFDFIQYWSAWELMLQGRNPYDPSLLHATQSALIDGEAELVYSWNPPWTYTLLAPFLTLPFTASATIWMVFEVLALLFIAAQTPKAIRVASLGPVWGTAATLAFRPTLYCLRYGQLGIFFALSVTCFLLTVNNKNYRLAGLSLLPLSAKPHLFLLCVIPGIVWLTQIPRTARRDFLIASCTGAAFLALATMLIQPHAFMWWFQSMTADVSSTSGLVPYQNWIRYSDPRARSYRHPSDLATRCSSVNRGNRDLALLFFSTPKHRVEHHTSFDAVPFPRHLKLWVGVRSNRSRLMQLPSRSQGGFMRESNRRSSASARGYKCAGNPFCINRGLSVEISLVPNLSVGLPCAAVSDTEINSAAFTQRSDAMTQLS